MTRLHLADANRRQAYFGPVSVTDSRLIVIVGSPNVDVVFGRWFRPGPNAGVVVTFQASVNNGGQIKTNHASLYLDGVLAASEVAWNSSGDSSAGTEHTATIGLPASLTGGLYELRFQSDGAANPPTLASASRAFALMPLVPTAVAPGKQTIPTGWFIPVVGLGANVQVDVPGGAWITGRGGNAAGSVSFSWSVNKPGDGKTNTARLYRNDVLIATEGTWSSGIDSELGLEHTSTFTIPAYGRQAVYRLTMSSTAGIGATLTTGAKTLSLPLRPVGAPALGDNGLKPVPQVVSFLAANAGANVSSANQFR